MAPWDWESSRDSCYNLPTLMTINFALSLCASTNRSKKSLYIWDPRSNQTFLSFRAWRQLTAALLNPLSPSHWGHQTCLSSAPINCSAGFHLMLHWASWTRDLYWICNSLELTGMYLSVKPMYYSLLQSTHTAAVLRGPFLVNNIFSHLSHPSHVDTCFK